MRMRRFKAPRYRRAGASPILNCGDLSDLTEVTLPNFQITVHLARSRKVDAVAGSVIQDVSTSACSQSGHGAVQHASKHYSTTLLEEHKLLRLYLETMIMLKSKKAMSRTSEISWVTEASLLTQTLCNLLTSECTTAQYKRSGS